MERGKCPRLPQDILGKAIELFGRKFLFVYPDHGLSYEDMLSGRRSGSFHGYYGICSACGASFPYDRQLPTEDDRKYRNDLCSLAYYRCPNCEEILEVRKGWYGKHGLKDRFYLQAWEVPDHDIVILHEAVIALDGRTDDPHYKGAWEHETCWHQRCTTLTPGHNQTVRWDGRVMKNPISCSNFERCGCNIIPTRSIYYPMTEYSCTMGLDALRNSFAAPFVRACEGGKIEQERAPDYIIRMNEEPITELFMKTGFYKIAQERAYKTRSARGTCHIDFTQRSPKKMLRGMKKNDAEQKMKQLMKLMPKDTTLQQLEMCAELFVSGKVTRPEDAAGLIQIDVNKYDYQNFVDAMLKYKGFPVSRFISYISVQHAIYRYYLDYLSLAEELGKPMNERRTLFPENLREAHDKLTAEKQYIYDKLTRERARKRRSGLAALGYEWSSDGVCAVIPESADDIKREGKVLLHCVGNYCKSHAEGRTNIIFIRRTSDPETPWFTLEVDPETRKFRQCYGYRNQIRGKDDPEVGPFLEKYAAHLERAAKNKGKKVQEDKKCRKTA